MAISIKTVAFLNSFIDDVRQTNQNAQALDAKKAERRLREDQFKLKKRKFQAILDADEASGEITLEDARRKRDIFKAFEGAEKGKNNLESEIQSRAFDKNNQEKKQQLGVISQIQSMTLKEDSKGGVSLSRTLKQPKADVVKATTSEKISGKIISDDEITTREEATNKAIEMGGINFKTKFPGVQSTIDESFPQDEDNQQRILEQLILGLKDGSVKKNQQVNVILPGGQTGTVPANKLEGLMSLGAKLAL